MRAGQEYVVRLRQEVHNVTRHVLGSELLLLGHLRFIKILVPDNGIFFRRIARIELLSTLGTLARVETNRSRALGTNVHALIISGTGEGNVERAALTYFSTGNSERATARGALGSNRVITGRWQVRKFRGSDYLSSEWRGNLIVPCPYFFALRGGKRKVALRKGKVVRVKRGPKREKFTPFPSFLHMRYQSFRSPLVLVLRIRFVKYYVRPLSDGD